MPLRIIIVYIFLSLVSVAFSGNALAAFNKQSSLPSIVICQVKSFGTKQLLPEYYSTFKELLEENILDTKRFQVKQIAFIDSMVNDIKEGSTKQCLNELHLNTIVNTTEINSDDANEELLKFAAENGIIKRHIKSKYINSEMKKKLNEYGLRDYADYLVFCNFKSMQVKNTFTEGSAYNKNINVKRKMSLEIDCTVIKCTTGEIFIINSFSDKSSQKIALKHITYGKSIPIKQILYNLFEVHASRIAHSIVEKVL